MAGRPLFARFGSTGGSGIDYGYDGAKRLSSETSFGRALTFGYDIASNRTRLTYPDSNYIDYDPDALNRIWKIRENGATTGPGVLATITWDPMSRRDLSTRGNGTSTNYDYDSASRLILLTQELTGTAKDLTRSFTHNAAGQIRTRNTTGTAYDYQAPIANKTYVPDGLNRYATVASTSFTYDANGNLTFDGTRTFLYDVENRLIRVTMAGVQTDLSYDPLGRLYSLVTPSSTTQFLYDGDRLVAEYNGSSVLQRRYVHGPGVDEPVVWYEGSGLTTRAWLHADERGSIVATSDSGGNGTEYKYGPYGEPTSWSGVRFRYTGQIALPELQLYHYKARVYDPVLGRFLQTDPIGYDDDANLYTYVRNDPIRGRDPTGNCDDPQGVGCPTTGNPQNTKSPTHAPNSVEQMKIMVSDAKEAGDKNIKGSFHQRQTNATGGLIESNKMTDATVTSTASDGTNTIRNGEIASTNSRQTVDQMANKLDDLASLAPSGTKVINYLGDLVKPLIKKLPVLGVGVDILTVPSESKGFKGMGAAGVLLDSLGIGNSCFSCADNQIEDYF